MLEGPKKSARKNSLPSALFARMTEPRLVARGREGYSANVLLESGQPENHGGALRWRVQSHTAIGADILFGAHSQPVPSCMKIPMVWSTKVV
jgi:hypothetical protein